MKIPNPKFPAFALRASAGRQIPNGFTLVEALIAVSIFAVVSTIVASLYIQSFQEGRRANMRNQIYEDVRFLMQRIADEISANMVDYDEYYNQNVVLGTLDAGESVPGTSSTSWHNLGQNYGRYYSSFFNPGGDGELGFRCNDRTRNRRGCAPVRSTIDRHTGQNPFGGKYGDPTPINAENAFCATVRYTSGAAGDNKGLCNTDKSPNESQARTQQKLFLISAGGRQKTILAQEKIGAVGGVNMYALSILRLDGVDMNDDNIPDKFICDEQFQCRGTRRVITASTATIDDSSCSGTVPAELPRDADSGDNFADLIESPGSCDSIANGFAKDFVPITPFRINVKDIKFIISPLENPSYAFAETGEQKQPRVTVVLTVENNPEYSGALDPFEPITLVETITTRVNPNIPAPLLVN